MTDLERQVFRRKIIGERVLLMLPLNVVLAARIRGAIDQEGVTAALDRLRSRHPLLAVRAEIVADGTGAYLGSNVPPLPVHAMARDSDNQWLLRVKEELQTPFPIETGPLVRCSFVHSESVCDVILCGHHAICDGMSLGYLLRDLLECIAEPKKEIAASVIPPPIDSNTVPNPPSTRTFQHLVMGLINRRWGAKGIQFSESDMRRMHEKYWENNTGIQLLAWTLDADETEQLAERSRAEKVTVNSTIWAAFLAAQHEVQKDHLRYRQRSALAVSTRDKLNVPVGDAALLKGVAMKYLRGAV
ncbi:MAG: condensation domain-containing protein [Desulfotignum sp.]